MAETVVSAVKPGGRPCAFPGLSCFCWIHSRRANFCCNRRYCKSPRPTVSHPLSPLFQRRWLRWSAVALGSVLGLWVLAWLLVPWLLRSQLEQAGSEQLGRRVTVGQVSFSPWTLELRVRDLGIATADGTALQLQIQHLYIDAELQSLWRLAPVADAVELDGVHLKLTRTGDGLYDIDDILARLASRPAPQAPSEPTRFALYNLALRDGSVEFNDQTVGQVHALRQAELTLPFLSNLTAYRDVKVTPRVAFELNGTAFESDALATPFTDDRKAAVRLQMAGLDVTPFAGYVPKTLPGQLKSGSLAADLRLEFEQAQLPVVKLQGTVELRDVVVVDLRKRDLLAFKALKLVLADVQPLKKQVHLDALDWEGLRAQVRRSADGTLEILDGGAGGARGGASKDAPATPRPSDVSPWAVTLRQANVRAASLDWIDASMGDEPARLSARNLELHGSAIAWPLQRPLQFMGAALLQGIDASTNPASLSFSGEVGSSHATVAASVRRLSLNLAAPYLKQVLAPRVQGWVDADLGVAWNGAALVAKVANLVVNEAALACPSNPSCPSLQDAAVSAAGKGQGRLVDLRRLEVADALLNMRQRTLEVGRIALDQPRAVVSRDADGRWMFQDWMVREAAAPAASSASPVRHPSPDADAAAPWAVHVKEAVVEGGALGFRDLAQARPVSLNLSSVQIRVKDLRPLATRADASPLSVSARIAAGRYEPGRVEFEGTVGMAPWTAQGRLLASRVPLQAFEPYFGDQLNATVVRAEGSFTGDVRHQAAAAGPSTWVRGDVSLDDVRVRSKVLTGAGGEAAPAMAGRSRAGEDLLNWKALVLRGFGMADVPGQPLSVEIKETSLSDFFARIIVQENGRLNLQDILKTSSAQRAASDVPAPAVQSEATPAVRASASSTGETGAARGATLVRVGPVTLAGGAVRFTDLFVKPNYSANLTELTGRLSAFSSEAPQGEAAPQMADLELRGRAEGTASLEIVGQLNPLAKPLALDITGRMRDLELPPLSPYSVKYAGHGIERGKLSMDVTYRVLPDGQLTASNKLVLHQLAFGEPVQGAPASLPVRLAVALLADRNGVIDIDLPISGSLNDPEFRLSSVILRVVGNLVMKAVTAPFSLLAGAFGGSSELSSVEFEAGSAVLSAQAQQGLDKVAQALADRPALKMTVVGEALLEAEREAWKKAQLKALVQAQKRRSAIRAGGQQPEGGTALATQAEYPALLKEVYRRADMDKPRNLVGLAKDLSDAEMEALLLAQIQVPDGAMRQLAVARSVAVRDYLAQRQVPLERLFVGAARTEPSPEGWAPHAELTLATR
ncbi:MAG: DUF748 domain-containing protein [Comamonadaceae bacterium]|nr:MAG: DUF748 domain-containing protein [Comamonadaceae bacterium]